MKENINKGSPQHKIIFFCVAVRNYSQYAGAGTDSYRSLIYLRTVRIKEKVSNIRCKYLTTENALTLGSI